MKVIPDQFNANKTYEWHSGDTESNWKKSRKEFGPDWYYYNKPIEYKFNSIGYRGPDTVFRDYFVAFGCSHTMGVGIHLEDTYCHLLSTELELDYFNFGLGGAAQNFVWTNSIMFAKEANPLPKFVVMQWPEVERLTIHDDERINLFLPNYHGDDDTTRAERNLYYNLIESETFLHNQARMYFESANLCWRALGVPVVNFTLSIKTGELFGIECFKGWTENRMLAARDLVHPGPIHNRQFADYIKNNI